AMLVNLATSVTGLRPAIDLAALIDPAGRAARLADAVTGHRAVWFNGAARNTPVYRRERLPVDAAFAGPAIVEQMDTTLVVDPGDRVETDAQGNLVVTLGEA
ncbi:MAG: hydantoinase/oxoprolinase family protein, partial [Gemmobacter sp.]